MNLEYYDSENLIILKEEIIKLKREIIDYQTKCRKYRIDSSQYKKQVYSLEKEISALKEERSSLKCMINNLIKEKTNLNRLIRTGLVDSKFDTKGSPIIDSFLKLRTDNNDKNSVIEYLSNDLKERNSVKTEDAKNKGIRELVEQLIIYAEKENLSVAREIKIALTTKMANGYIASNILTPEWTQRLENLGREKRIDSNTMNFNNHVGTVVAHADKVIYNKDYE